MIKSMKKAYIIVEITPIPEWSYFVSDESWVKNLSFMLNDLQNLIGSGHLILVDPAEIVSDEQLHV